MEENSQPHGNTQKLGSRIFPGVDQTRGFDQLASYHEHEHRMVNAGTIFGLLLNCYEALSMASSENADFGNAHSFLLSNSEHAHECYATWVSIEKSLDNKGGLTIAAIMEEYPEYEKYYRISESIVSGLKGSLYRRAVMSAAIYVSFHARMPCDAAIADFKNPDFDFSGSLEFPNERFLHIASLFRDGRTVVLAEDFLEEHKESPSYRFLIDEYNGIVPPAEHPEIMAAFTAIFRYMFEKFAAHFEEQGSGTYALADAQAVQKEISELMLPFLSQMGVVSSEGADAFRQLRDHAADPENVHWGIGIKHESELIQLAPKLHYCTILWPSDIDGLKEQILEGDDFKRLNIMFRGSDSMKGQYHFLDEEHREWFEREGQVRVFIRKAYTYDDSLVIVLIPFEHVGQLTAFLENLQEEVKTAACVSHSALSGLGDQWVSFLDNGGFDHLYYLNDESLVQILDTTDIKPGEKIMFSNAIIEYNSNRALALIFCYQNEKTGNKEIHFVPCSHGYSDFILGFIPVYYPDYSYSIDFFDLEIYIGVQSVMRSIYMEETTWYFRTFYFSDRF